MKKEPKINLAKCKIGQKLKTRDGHTFTFDGRSGNFEYPFQVKEATCLYTEKGTYFRGGAENRWDIIAILPLPKKKAKAPPRLQKALKLPAPLDKQAIKAAIKTLQALLK